MGPSVQRNCQPGAAPAGHFLCAPAGYVRNPLTLSRLPGTACAPTEPPAPASFPPPVGFALSEGLEERADRATAVDSPSEAAGRRIERRLSVAGFDAPPAEAHPPTSVPYSVAPTWATLSRAGCDPVTGTKRNQDTSFAHQGSRRSVLGVFDGHGPLGHLVAHYLADRFHRTLIDSRGVESAQAALSLAFATCAAGLSRRGESGASLRWLVHTPRSRTFLQALM